MSEVFANSGESSDITAGPPPQLQGLFLPGIDNSQFADGFGIVTPWGGGSTARRYGDYGISPEISRQSTQLNDLASSLIPAGGGNLSYGLQGDKGPQGLRGLQGLPGIITVMGLNLPQNSNFLSELPHNIDQMNALGTAADKLVYTDSFGSFYSEFVWTERQPSTDWVSVASNADGTNLIAAVDGGRLYTSDDSGATWTERTPAGAANKNWQTVVSDSDGSHLMAGIHGGRLYTSANYGVNWTERQPEGDDDIYWYGLASDSDGSHLVAGVDRFNGKIYTSANYGATWTERTPPLGANDTYYHAAASDSDGSNLIIGTDERLYTTANSGASWTERQPAGDVDRSWASVASDSDGSNLIAAANNGELYTSDDSGATWTERTPAGAGAKYWLGVASDDDGSHLVAGITNGRVYVSVDFGVTWVETQPGGDLDGWWVAAASDSDGSNLILAWGGFGSGKLYVGTQELLYSEATWAEADLTSAGRALLDDADAASQATTLGLGTGDAVTHDTLLLTSIAAEGSDVDKFLVDSTGVIKYRTGTEILSDIGASASSHLHDGSTLQHDGVNSDGGVFSFTTTGLVTFNQSIAAANYAAANLLTAAASNAGEVDFTAASKKLDVEDNAVVSQDYTSDASPTFAGMILTGLTQGSVVFAGASGVISQDNSNLFWDNVNKKFGVGTPTPNAPLEVKGAKPAGNIGGHQSGMFHVTGNGTDEFSNSVITGHNSFDGNTQLWYLGSTTVNNDDIAFINRQNAAMHFYTNNASRMTIDAAGNITLATIAAEGSDVDKFLVSSSGVVKYRTGAQVLSDIGGQASDTGLTSLAGLGYVSDSMIKITAEDTYEIRTMAEVKTDLGLVIGTNVQAFGAVLDDLNTLGAVGADSEFLVGTGAGALTWESGATVRTSLGLEIATTQTVNLLQADNSAAKQAKIDAVPKFIPSGVIVTFQFETGGTHTETATLTWVGFYGGGTIEIYGNTGEAGATTLHTTQDTYLDWGAASVYWGFYFYNCQVAIEVFNLKMRVNDTAGYSANCIEFKNCVFQIATWYNYFLAVGSVRLTRGLRFVNCVAGHVFHNYFATLRYGIECNLSRAISYENDDVGGSSPVYGLFATQTGAIGKRSTQPTGSTADELATFGGEIR